MGGGGIPHHALSWLVPPFSPGWGVSHPSWWGGTPGYSPSRTGWDTPLPSRTGWGIPPPIRSQSSIASTANCSNRIWTNEKNYLNFNDTNWGLKSHNNITDLVCRMDFEFPGWHEIKHLSLTDEIHWSNLIIKSKQTSTRNSLFELIHLK